MGLQKTLNSDLQNKIKSKLLHSTLTTCFSNKQSYVWKHGKGVQHKVLESDLIDIGLKNI